jgi:hypothetical protein
MREGIGVMATFESFDRAMLGELTEYVEGVLSDPWSLDHDYRKALESVDCYLHVINDHCNTEQFKAYMDSIRPQYEDLVLKATEKVSPDQLSFTVLKVRDLPDGGCNIEFEANEKMRDYLMGVGLQHLIMEAVGKELGDVQGG